MYIYVVTYLYESTVRNIDKHIDMFRYVDGGALVDVCWLACERLEVHPEQHVTLNPDTCTACIDHEIQASYRSRCRYIEMIQKFLRTVLFSLLFVWLARSSMCMQRRCGLL